MAAEVLVADVGGTNTRLARAGADGIPHDIARFPNDSFDGFGAVLDRYFSAQDAPVSACCVAVAGPVTPERARLTNRDWSFERDAISARVGGAPVRLVNDLAALGHALPGLRNDQVETLREGAGTAVHNGQALVLGLGTGVNVCLAKTIPEGLVVVEAEFGHGSLPASVHEALHRLLGQRASAFSSTELLFSGRGLAQFHTALTGETAQAQDIAAKAPETVRHAAHLLGLLSRELVFHYLPLDGVRFAGSVARSILGTAGRDAFLAAAEPGDRAFANLVAQVPLGLITDDAAALTGLARLGLSLGQRPIA